MQEESLITYIIFSSFVFMGFVSLGWAGLGWAGLWTGHPNRFPRAVVALY